MVVQIILNVSLLYNSLPEEQQLAISAVPPDLLEESGLVKTEDAEVSAQEDELCGYPLAPEEVECQQKFLETVVRLPLLAPGRAQKHFHTASPAGAAV